MDKKLGLVGLLFLLPALTIAQTYSKRFEEVFNRQDSAGQRQLLAEWQANKPLDADLQVAYFNFYKQRYEQEADSLIQEGLVSEAFSHIDSGIKAFPNRLDMRFDRISLLWNLGNYSDYKETILALLEQHDVIKGGWLWKNNSSLINATDFLLKYVDNYVVQLYNLDDESLHPYMDEIANRVLISHPRHVPSLSNLAITALYHEDYPTAIEHLTKALSIEAENTSVLSNLAFAYVQVGNTEKAIAYYEQMAKYGDSQTKAYAAEQLEKLVR
ncbi:tetratricopeptide repeat protein [Parapedobacter pyrenivorans]|uniref:tetratricopeptide repeat protein n=1 Tax=Parapedobacter pyrenivorans TaxID=1305674 RepID=UPI003341A44D